jgi:hypothetical protein
MFKSHMTGKPRRRWFSYSLRTLFVVLTVLCVWLGVETNRVRNQRYLVQVIEKNGGEVLYQHQIHDHRVDRTAEAPGPRWLRNLIGDDYFRRICVVELRYYSIPFSDKDMQLIGSFASLEKLDIPMQPISDEAIHYLDRLHNLRNISFLGPDLTDDGMRSIARFDQLEFLQILAPTRNQITDGGLAAIKNLKHLQTLDVSNSQITDAGLTHLQGLSLKRLCLWHTAVSDDGVAAFRETNPTCRIDR